MKLGWSAATLWSNDNWCGKSEMSAANERNFPLIVFKEIATHDSQINADACLGQVDSVIHSLERNDNFITKSV